MNSIELPLKTVAGLNAREHWATRAKRVKAERAAGYIGAKQLDLCLPCKVTMTRLSAGTLDGDNLQGAFKACRDGIADALGVSDNDPRVLWLYAQEGAPRKSYAVRIKIDPVYEVEEALAMGVQPCRG